MFAKAAPGIPESVRYCRRQNRQKCGRFIPALTTLGIKQAAVSKIERRADLYVSTLARFIEAMGGELEIRAVFPEGSIRLKKFGEPTNSLS